MNIRITMVLHEGIRHLKTTKSSVEDKLHDICQELRQNKPQNKPHWRNLSAIDCEKLSQKKMSALRVLDTDENLGPALVSTDWVKNESLKQLNDKQSYSIITYEDWILIHGQIIGTREELMLTFSRFITTCQSKGKQHAISFPDGKTKNAKVLRWCKGICNFQNVLQTSGGSKI